MNEFKEIVVAFLLALAVGSILTGLIVSGYWQASAVDNKKGHYEFDSFGNTIFMWNTNCVTQ